MLAETAGTSALAVYEQPRTMLIPAEQTSNSAMALAKLAAASGLCKTQKAADAFFVIMYGYEIGIPAMTALRTIHIINNTPVCSGEALLAIIRRSQKVDIKITGTATEATVYMKRRDTGEEYTAYWTIARATTAGLSGKDVWKKFPQAFLQWRGVSECSKFLCSDITNGLYTIEEIAPDSQFSEDGEIVGEIIISKPEPEAKPDYRRKIDPEQYPPLEALEPEPHWSEDMDTLCRLADRCFENKFIGQGGCDGIPAMEALIAPKKWTDYPTLKEASLAVKAAFEALQAELRVSDVVSTEQARQALGSGGKRRVNAPAAPEPDYAPITAPDSPFAVNPTPAATSNGGSEAANGTTSVSLSNSAFNRGLSSYQAQQEQARVDYQNEELDAMFARAMERNP